jgi:tyrocidine synthetase III
MTEAASDRRTDTPISISRQVRADRDIAAGEIVFVLPGVYTQDRDFYTIEVRPGLHQAFTDDIDDYINHSCDPSLELVVEGDDAVPEAVYFRAKRDIKKGEEVNWDYLTAESDISAPFACGCGAANCRGRIG